MAERQLPKLNVAGSIPVSRSIKINNLQNSLEDCAPFVLHLHHEHALLQLVERWQSRTHRRLRVDVLVHIEAVAELVSNELPVNAQSAHQC